MTPQITPWIDESDAAAVQRVMTSTYITEQDETSLFESMLCELTASPFAIAYANATCGLFAALRSLGIGAGDEVIVPDLTFVATANAVILAGATPVFCDVDPVSMTMHPASAATRITLRTKAIMPVHLYGTSADMDALIALAKEHGLAIVEDAAQGVGVRWRDRHVGTFGQFGVLSFYGNKTITTGEGGVILTADKQLAEKCIRLKNHGRLKKGVFVHEEIGFNFCFTDLQAALGVAQLEKLHRVIADKERIFNQYAQRLAKSGVVSMKPSHPNVSPVHWFTNVFCEDVESLAEVLSDNDIVTRRFFCPLHLQPCYQHLQPEPCPVSQKLFETGLSLPSFCGIQDETINFICDVILGHGAPV